MRGRRRFDLRIVVTLALFLPVTLTAARAEVWELDVATARSIPTPRADGGTISILLSTEGFDLFERLINDAKNGPLKEIRVHGTAISLARYDRARRELRILMRGVTDDQAQALANRLVSGAAKLEVVEATEK